MIWSTLRIVSTASIVSLIAQLLVSILSRIYASFISLTYPSLTSIPYTDDFVVSAYIFAIISSAFNPAFSAKVLGITSNA
jgi:hypothetical protein